MQPTRTSQGRVGMKLAPEDCIMGMSVLPAEVTALCSGTDADDSADLAEEEGLSDEAASADEPSTPWEAAGPCVLLVTEQVGTPVGPPWGPLCGPPWLPGPCSPGSAVDWASACASTTPVPSASAAASGTTPMALACWTSVFWPGPPGALNHDHGCHACALDLCPTIEACRMLPHALPLHALWSGAAPEAVQAAQAADSRALLCRGLASWWQSTTSTCRNGRSGGSWPWARWRLLTVWQPFKW